MATTVNRNDPCPCGSGRKYKSCCMNATSSGVDRRSRVTLIIVAIGVIASAGLGFTVGSDPAKLVMLATAIVAAAWFMFSDPPAPRGGGDPGAINFGN